MAQRYWAPKPLESETLMALGTFPSNRAVKPEEILDLLEARINGLIRDSRSQGLDPDQMARELLSLDAKEVTGALVMETDQAFQLQMMLDYNGAELTELPQEQAEAMESLSFLTVLEALSMLQ